MGTTATIFGIGNITRRLGPCLDRRDSILARRNYRLFGIYGRIPNTVDLVATESEWALRLQHR